MSRTCVGSGHCLLERYGMSEIGMALSNSLDYHWRIPSSVGTPLPGVSVRVVTICRPEPSGGDVSSSAANIVEEHHLQECAPGEAGELLVKGANVFSGYLFREEATRASFVGGVPGGWFLTGDTAVCVPVDQSLQASAAECRAQAGLPVDSDSAGGGGGGGVIQCSEERVPSHCYKILGRSSIDIIKSGGYKLSALEIESALLELPYISEAAVVGLEDAEWGESVAAALVVNPNTDVTDLSLQRVRTDGKALMAPYKLPKTIKIVDSLPRNAMGKVEKSKVKPLFL